METTIRRTLSVAALMVAIARFAAADEPTAFELIKAGNDYVGKDSKDRVVQIRSEKSTGSLTPSIWYVVYYDADATFKSTEVKFGAGKKLKVTRPARVIELGTGNDKTLDRSKFKADSDQAIKTATAEPLLKSLTLKATQLWLQHGDAGPVWKVKMWAAKLKNPADDADIGEIYVAAENGKVVRIDLHLNSVN